ncbi:MAG: flippase [Richelia sp. RM2_1_2]|nr:flippase [Richelia sp. SM1_7_0]NJN10174.1 flippase [Richelia sp. RM1_1_1]NJO31212.1 flippase [Richelia sp. SL_2_1]NJO57966.1 flippase [Richelia sp. RM2_1_2]
MNILLQKLSLLKSRSGFRVIFANTVWLFLDRILRMGVGLFISVWIARYLGVQQFGIFNYATAFFALFSTLSTLGLDAIVVRSIVHEPENREQILGTAFWLKLIGGVGCLLLAFCSIFILRHDDKLTIELVVVLSSVGIFKSFDTIDFWFQSQVQSKYTVVAKNTAFIIVTLLKLALITMKAPLIAFAWAGLVEVALGAVGLILAYKVNGHSIWLWCWSFPLAKSLLKESYPLILSGFAIMIYVKTDQIMLGQMLGDKAVGIYSAATSISEVWYFVPTVIVSSVTPSIFAQKKVSEALYYRKLEQLLHLLGLLSIFIAVPISLLSAIIITMIFGSSYAEAAIILRIHIWACIFVFMGVGASPWFISEGLTQLSFRRTLIGSILNVFLNIFLIPRYAGLGAAIATVISYAFGSVLANAIDTKSWRIFILQVKSILIFRF